MRKCYAFSKKNHNIELSIPTLARYLSKYQLTRTSPNLKVTDDQLEQLLRSTQSTPACQFGYRSMQSYLIKEHGKIVAQKTIAKKQRELNPKAVASRKRRKLSRRMYINDGPNDVWHIDQHDKLKQYGFPLHCCVDGYSRKIIWIEYVASNNDPDLTVKLYLRAVELAGGAPRITRTDHGSENNGIALANRFFNGDMGAHRFGSSTSNTRVEGMWDKLRRMHTQWWMMYFSRFVEIGEYDLSNPVHKHLCIYIHLPILKQQLKQWKEIWNSHSMRKTKVGKCPSGKPEVRLVEWKDGS